MQSDLERIATLEERIHNMDIKLERMSLRVDDIYEIIQRGKGAKWALVGLVSFVSWGLGIFVHKILPM
jgi:hypothetical protein